MVDRPILFSGEMVRAILDGRKTQTRRVMKPQPPEDVTALRLGRYNPTVVNRHGEEDAGQEIFGAYDDHGEYGCRCPYGEPGDRLWARETWGMRLDEDKTTIQRLTRSSPWYAADRDPPDSPSGCAGGLGRWRPSIHMPRWASRITLEITKVRAERLQEISLDDCVAEGVTFPPAGRSVGNFAALWDSINGKRATWANNPWVLVLEFKRV